MLLLCIDTATPQVGVAVGCDDQLIGRVHLARPRHHAEHLAPAIRFLCEQLDVSLDQLSAIGVGIGPGLYTGLRVGVTTAKVMAQALRIPLVGVPSLDLLAFDARYSDRLVVPVVDARRGEVFYATYRQVPGGIQRLSEYEVTTPGDLCAELLAKGEDVFLFGDGALAHREVFAQLERVELGPASMCYPPVSALVELTRVKLEREEFSLPREVHPLYLRVSDAEMNWVTQSR